jgi:hypothetical protein
MQIVVIHAFKLRYVMSKRCKAVVPTAAWISFLK